jgi:hypothetical protein
VSPLFSKVTVASGLERNIPGIDKIVCTIRIKLSIHRKGPGLEPWPGPKSEVVEELLYGTVEIPYPVFTK